MSPKSPAVPAFFPTVPTSVTNNTLTLEQARILVAKDKERRARVSLRRRAKLRDAKAMVKAADAPKA